MKTFPKKRFASKFGTFENAREFFCLMAVNLIGFTDMGLVN